MDILRRNTDYALRAMVNLAGHYGQEPVSTREISRREDISYQLACKLMQRLNNAGLVKSTMGPNGGFVLNRNPKKINLAEIINVIQGPLSLSRCLLGENACPKQKHCPITKKLTKLQKDISDYLQSVTLDEILHHQDTKKNKVKSKRTRR
ncbi:MAG: Rrf2 family transcriptional regulator [Sedimentisphaerales bacterium]|nr:Rrf2 family transcriptional regulator [Sedimentisphaerales bacterium]